LDLPVCVLEKKAPLEAWDEVMKQLLHLIMKTAPIGLGAYLLIKLVFWSSIIWCICEAIGSIIMQFVLLLFF
jgi:hypothetical protein